MGLGPLRSCSERQASDPAVLLNLPSNLRGTEAAARFPQSSGVPVSGPHPHRGSLPPLPTPHSPLHPRWRPGQAGRVTRCTSGDSAGKRWHGTPAQMKEPTPWTGPHGRGEPDTGPRLLPQVKSCHSRESPFQGSPPSQGSPPFQGSPQHSTDSCPSQGVQVIMWLIISPSLLAEAPNKLDFEIYGHLYILFILTLLISVGEVSFTSDHFP